MNKSDETKGSKRNVSMSILSYFCKKPRNDECVELDNNSCSTISNKVSSTLVHDQTIQYIYSVN